VKTYVSPAPPRRWPWRWPVAHADQNDAKFINWLEQNALGCGEGVFKCTDDSTIIPMGHAACTALDKGLNAQQTAQLVQESLNGWANRVQAQVIVVGAIAEYCPWQIAPNT
jgi:Protein of unknown function (DUF732)